jgi:magnesium-transporting ATPase (P-type)
MLRDLITTTLLVIAVAVFFADELASAVLLLLTALLYISLNNKAHHVLEKQLNLYAGRLLRVLAAIIFVAAFALLFSEDDKQIIDYAALLAISVMPLALPLAIRGHFALADNPKAQHNAIKIIRAALTSSAAFVTCVVVMALGAAAFDLRPVISLPQLLLVSLLLSIPLARLKGDPPHGKTLKVTAHNLYSHTLSRANLPHYLKSGMLAGGLAYGSYLLLFALNNLSPRYVDLALPLHTEATTLVSLTLLLCLFINILFERQDHHEVFSFDHFTQRASLLRMMGLALLIFVVVTSLPGFRSLFDSAPLGIVAWAAAIVLTGIYTGLRRLQRYMREHSRHAILNLHRNL